MLQRLPLTALKFRSPALRALVIAPEGRTRIDLVRALSSTNQQSLRPSCHRSFGSSPFQDAPAKKKKRSPRTFVPRKAPVEMTETARKFFKALLETKSDDDSIAGIMLNYNQSSTGEPRMVFSFDFVKTADLDADDEGASLELTEDGKPKEPVDSMKDGLPKLYINHNAFMKVLGGKVDVDVETMKLNLYDREGNVMDPNNT